MGLEELELHFSQRLKRIVNGKELTADEESSTIPSEQVASCDAEIVVTIHVEPMLRALSLAGLAPEDVELVSYRTSATRRLTQFVSRMSLADHVRSSSGGSIVASATRNNSEPDELLLGESAGFTLGLALVLARSLDSPRPLRPFQKGTWLTEATLRLRSKHENQDGILPIALTNECIAELRGRGIQVGPATLSYIEFGGDVLSENFRERLYLYIHEDFNDALGRLQKGEVGIDEVLVRYEVAKLGVEVICVVAHKSFLEIAAQLGSLQPDRDTVLEHISKLPGLASFIAKPLSGLGGYEDRKDEEIAVDLILLAGSEPSRLRALLEDCNKVGALTARALGIKP
jgi:hypothetical protein